MSAAPRKAPRLRRYAVSYWLEEGFCVIVEARSPEVAEELVRDQLDEHMGELPDSERVHYDDGITGAQLIRRKARHVPLEGPVALKQKI